MSTAPQPSITPEFAAGYRDVLADRIEFDAAATVRTIAAIPENKKSYAPAEKSRTAWQLAVHMAVSEVWFLQAIVNRNFDWPGDPPDPASTVAELVPWYKQNVSAVIAKVRALTPQQLSQ